MPRFMICGAVYLGLIVSWVRAGEIAAPSMAPHAAWTIDRLGTIAYPNWLQTGPEIRPELGSILSSEVGNLQYWIRVPKGARGTVVIAVGEAFWSEPGHRIMDVKIDGRVRASRIDPIAAAGGKHRLAAITCPAEDLDGDGLLHIQVVPSQGSPDHVTLAAGLWWIAVPGRFACLKVPHISQGWNLCGVAAATMATAFHGKTADQYETKRLCGSPPGDGTDWMDIVSAAARLGCQWELVTFPYDQTGLHEGADADDGMARRRASDPTGHHGGATWPATHRPHGRRGGL